MQLFYLLVHLIYKNRVMNKEFKIYGIFSVIIIGLLFIEFNSPRLSHANINAISQLPAIEKIVVNIPCNIYIQQSDENKIVIEQNGNYLSQIKASIEAEALTIDGNLISSLLLTTKSFLSTSSKINIYISLKDIKNMKLCDYCELTISGSINGEQLNLKVRQAGLMIMIDKKV